jgi:radical SAM superfamily enzyme YgiQ (UPF0313 family)
MKPKLQIIVLFQNLGDTAPYYAKSPGPPLSGLLLAGLTPPSVEVEVLHEMVRPVDYDTDADLIALSFMDYCAPHAAEVARRFRARGKTVIAGGRYASTFPEAVAPHVDAVVAGEAERVWPGVVEDALRGRLERIYRAPFGASLEGVPPPRYDLAEPQFAVPVVTEATRGCPFRCTYCQLNIRPAPFRCRPIPDVIRDLAAVDRLPRRKRRMAMLYDNNLAGDLGYAKELLAEIAGLKLWGLGTQFSLNALGDRDFLDHLERARCRMAFLGMESLCQESLHAVRKRQNRVAEYRERFRELKRRGILVFAGTMLAMEEDTPAYYRELPGLLEEVDPGAVFVSLTIPIPGTPLQRELEAAGRIRTGDLSLYDGDHLVVEPVHVTDAEVYDAVLDVRRRFYAWSAVFRRWLRLGAAYLLRRGGFRRIGPFALLTYILLSLSRFQRAHTRRRVEPLIARARGMDRRPSVRAVPVPAEEPGS